MSFLNFQVTYKSMEILSCHSNPLEKLGNSSNEKHVDEVEAVNVSFKFQLYSHYCLNRF